MPQDVLTGQGCLQGVVRRFAREHAAWEEAVQAVAELDALMSLAAVADVGSSQGPMCRPKLVTPQDDQQVSATAQLALDANDLKVH